MTELENPFAMPVLQRMLPLTGLGAGQFLVSILRTDPDWVTWSETP
jgi:hypothetical protein